MAANELETTTEAVEDVKDDALEVEIVDSLEEEAEVKTDDVEDDVEVKDDEAAEEVETEDVEEVEVKDDDEEVETKDDEEPEVETKDDDAETILSELVETKAVEEDDVRVKRLTELGIDPETVTEDQFYCAETKSMETEVHDDCRGGCAPEGELPGLLDIEIMAAKSYSGEIVRSGYASNERIFFVDIKREDDKYIEAAFGDNGEALGWTLLDSALIEEKSDEEPVEAITMVEAEEIALKEFPGATAVSGQTAIFEGIDSYVFEVDTEEGKSLDVYVGLNGEFAGFDEYVLEDESETKAAMPAPAAAPAAADDSKKLVEMIAGVPDKETLGKVVTAIGDDVDVVPDDVKMAIVKKATELKATDVLPEAWKKPAAAAPAAAPSAPAAAAAPAAPSAPAPKKPMDEEPMKKELEVVVDGETDEEFAAKVAEFQAMSETTQESE